MPSFVAGMGGASTWYGEVNQNGGFNILARVSSLDGTGLQVNVWEGNCLQQSDVAVITCQVRDLGTDKDNPTGTPVTPNPTLTPAGNLYNVLSQLGWPVAEDVWGWNFRHDVSPTYTGQANYWYLIEYKFVLTGGQVVWLRTKVKAVPIQSS
jgi:hypothetical protein